VGVKSCIGLLCYGHLLSELKNNHNNRLSLLYTSRDISSSSLWTAILNLDLCICDLGLACNTHSSDVSHMQSDAVASKIQLFETKSVYCVIRVVYFYRCKTGKNASISKMFSLLSLPLEVVDRNYFAAEFCYRITELSFRVHYRLGLQ